jgi:hypothetical protein
MTGNQATGLGANPAKAGTDAQPVTAGSAIS